MLNTQTMNLDLIRTFVIVGQSKDFYEAASKLNIDYTNVSRHIKALESLMGTKLIKKNSKSYIELTEDGKELFEGYEKAYNLLFITEKTFLQNKNLNSGKISIGISTNYEDDLLNDRIINFKNMFPNTAFKIINLPSKELYEKLSHYNVDFVIDETISTNKSSGIKSKNLYEEEFCLAYSNKYFKINSLVDIKDLPIFLPVSTKGERRLFENLLSDNSISKNLSIESANYKSIKSFALKGLGVAMLPKTMVNDSDNLEIFDLNIKKQVSISYIEENLSPSSKEFLKLFWAK